LKTFLEIEGSFLKRGYSLPFIMVFPAFRSAEEIADHVGETFKWHLRAASRHPQPLLEGYRDFGRGFTLPDVKKAARDFNILEII